MKGSDSGKKANPVKGTLPDAGGLETLMCQRWMTAKVHTVKPVDSVAHARSVLEKLQINQLPVIKDGILVGIVTDRDLRDAVSTVTTSGWRANAINLATPTPDEIPVEAIMTHNVITLAPHSTVVNATVIMRLQRIGSVPIVNGSRVVGIVTRSDVLDAFVARENGKRERQALGNDKAEASGMKTTLER